ncbi:hypothetical protein [Clostridium beijerinckii]|uniref:hypothetical protein n=1 Tax=Clostridium beijerinckii TaxID=1520 RepID=UPI0022E231D4|nr:hypothetical protein [Clostridium beijerinckii]
MNKKKILVFTLALSIIGTTSIATYAASQNTADATKNTVVTLDSKDNRINNTSGCISDEEAVQIATKAIKDYIGLDANSFGQAFITKGDVKGDYEYSKEDAAVLEENSKKHTDNIINVQFIPVDDLKVFEAAQNDEEIGDLKVCAPTQDLVRIDGETGEILFVSAFNNLDQDLKVEINDSKIKETTLNFFEKIGINIEYNTIRVGKDINHGSIEVLCNLQDGRVVELKLNIKDYSVMSYELNDKSLTVLKDHKENFRALQVK